MSSLRTRVHLSYILFLLLLVNSFNLADRLILGILQETIKGEFQLSDFQLGLLGGPAFAVLYSLLSLPVARFAEWGNRISIIAAATALWSGMTAMCGLAQSYLQLLLCRLGVSVGEAGASPPSLSFIADRFPPHRRGMAMAIYAAGGSIGTLVASLAGGALGQHYGWRGGFIAFGAVGIVLAIVVRLSIHETRTSFVRTHDEGFLQALKRLGKRRSIYHICAAGTFGTFCGTFLIQYMASFLIRVHHLPLAQGAAVVGLSIGVFGVMGVIAAGWFSDRLEARWPGARMLVGAGSMILAATFYTAAFWLPLGPAIVCLMIAGVGQSAFPALCFTSAASVAPAGTRATTLALFTLCVNILGYALGPPLLGMLSDLSAGAILDGQGLSRAACATMATDPACAAAGAQGLRIALTTAAMLTLGGAYHFLRARRFIAADVAAVDSDAP